MYCTGLQFRWLIASSRSSREKLTLLQKPGCAQEVLAYFRKHSDAGVTAPSHIAVVGDRLLTDVMLANLMGAQAIWVRNGVSEAGVMPGLVSNSQIL